MANLDKLQTNIPRTGTLSAVYFAKSKKPEYGDQIKLVGQWEREGEGQFWLSLPAVDAFTDAGLVQYAGVKDNEPTWRVLYPTQRIAIVRREDGRKKITEVFPVNDQGQQMPAFASQPKSVLPPPTTAAAAAPAPAAATSAAPIAAPLAGAPVVPPAAAAPVASHSGPGDRSGSAREALTPAQVREQMRKRWAELDERYAVAVAIATYRLREALGPEVEPQVIQAGAATVLIESNKLNLQALPGLAKALRDRANGKPAKPDPATPAGELFPRQPAAVGAGKAPGGYEDFDETDGGEDDELPF